METMEHDTHKCTNPECDCECVDTCDEGSTQIEIEFDPDLFSKGIAETSEVCGKLAALMSVGIEPEAAINYILERELNLKAMKTQIELARLGYSSQID